MQTDIITFAGVGMKRQTRTSPLRSKNRGALVLVFVFVLVLFAAGCGHSEGGLPIILNGGW
jgi:hypothetical protein